MVVCAGVVEKMGVDNRKEKENAAWMRSGIMFFSKDRAAIVHSSQKLFTSVQSAKKIHPNQHSINPSPSPSQST